MTKKDFIGMMRHTQAPLKGMIEMVPEDKPGWAPGKTFMSMGQLLKHISENWLVIRMMVKKEWPAGMTLEQLAEAMKLENLPRCTKAEALEAIEKDLNNAVAFVENEISEKDFFSTMVSAPWGFKGEIWKAVLMAKDHQVNHKMQLHLYLKLLGKPVDTNTLYGM